MAAAATDQLAIDSLRFMEFGADHVDASKFMHPRPQANVGTAARHVRGHGNFPMLTCRRNDFRFSDHVFRIQYDRFDALLGKQIG